MAATDNTFQARIVADLQARGDKQAAKAFTDLLELEKQLGTEAKKTAAEITKLFRSFRKTGDEDTLNEALLKLKGISGELKNMRTARGARDLFTNGEIQNVNKMEAAIRSAAKAFDAINKGKQVTKGVFGLDSKSVAEARRSLKSLQELSKSVNLALGDDNSPSTQKRLQSQQRAIEKNIQNVRAYIETLNKARMEETVRVAEENRRQTLNLQNELDKRRRLMRDNDAAIREDQSRQSGRYQARIARNQFDRTEEGRQSAMSQYRLSEQRQRGYLDPAYVRAQQDQINRRGYNSILSSAYADANLRRTVPLGRQGDSAQTTGYLQQIVALENQIVQSRRQGTNTLQNERDLMKQIADETRKVTHDRQQRAMRDPDTQQRQAQSMINRSTGVGAAGLMTVQASWMASGAVLYTITNSLQRAIGFSIELEAAFKNLQAVTATTSTEMIGLEDAIMKASNATRFTSVEVAEAALVLGQAGLSAAQIAQAIEPVTVLAAATGTSLKETVDLVTSVVGVFDVTAADVGDIANKLTAAVNMSKLSVDKLVLGFQYTGNAAAQLGVTFEETTAAMAAMSNAGIKSGSTLGTGLRQFLTELQKPSEEFIATLQRIGLTIEDLDVRSKGLTGVVETLSRAGFVASDAIKSFDVRSAAAFNALIADPRAMRQQLDALEQTSAALDANAVQMDSFQSQWIRLGSILGNISAQALEPALVVLKNIFSTVSDGLETIAEFNGVLQVLGVLLSGIAAAGAAKFIGTLVGGFATLFPAVAGVTSSLTAVATTLTRFVPILTPILALLSGPLGIGVAVAAVTAGFVAYNNVSSSTAKQVDEVTARFNTSKATVSEYTEVIDNLDNRLESLRARQGNLKDGSAELRTEILSLSTQYGKWGFAQDTVNSKLSDTITRLAGVRQQIARLRSEELAISATEAANVADAQLKAANEQLQSSRQSPAIRRGLETLQDPRVRQQLSSNPSIGSERINVLFSAMDSLRNAKSPGEVQNLGSAGQILNQIGGMDAASMRITPAQRASIQRLAEAIPELAKEVQKANVANQDAMSASRRVELDRESTRVRANFAGPGVSFDSQLGLGGNIKATARANLPENERTNQLAVSNEIARLVQVERERNAVLQKQIDALATSGTSEEVITALRMEANANLEKAVAAGAESIGASAVAFKRQNNAEADSLAFKQGAIELRARRSGGAQADVDAWNANLDQRYANKLAAETRGMNPESEAYYDIVRGIEKSKEEEREKFKERLLNWSNSSSESAIRSMEEQIEREIATANAQAGALKRRANANLLPSKIQELADAGLKYVGDVYDAEKRLLKAKYKNDPERLSAEMENLEAKYEASRDSYISSFRSVIEASYKRLYGDTQRFKELKNQLDSEEQSSAERIYQAGSGLRASQDRMTLMGGAVSGRGYSDTQRQLEQRRQYDYQAADFRLRADAARRQNAIQNAQLEENARSLAGARAKKAGIDSQLQEAGVSTDLGEDASQYNVQLVAQKALEKQINELVAQRNELLKGERESRQSIHDLEMSAQTVTSTNQETASVQAFNTALGESWDLYKQTIGEVNIAADIADGMTGTLNSLGGQFTGFFKSVVSGTKSVGDAFRDLALNVVDSLLQIAAQAAAMAIFKSIVGALGGSMGSSSSSFSSSINTSGYGPSTSSLGSGTYGINYLGSRGGLMTTTGFKRFAGGGMVTGGKPNQDSVPSLLMPGEVVMTKKAVETLGADTLLGWNQQANTITSQSGLGQVNQNQGGGDRTVNVWLVSPDQEPVPGPEDIVATVSDNITRNGQLKKLIQSISMNRM